VQRREEPIASRPSASARQPSSPPWRPAAYCWWSLAGPYGWPWATRRWAWRSGCCAAASRAVVVATRQRRASRDPERSGGCSSPRGRRARARAAW